MAPVLQFHQCRQTLVAICLSHSESTGNAGVPDAGGEAVFCSLSTTVVQTLIYCFAVLNWCTGSPEAAGGSKGQHCPTRNSLFINPDQLQLHWPLRAAWRGKLIAAPIFSLSLFLSLSLHYIARSIHSSIQIFELWFQSLPYAQVYKTKYLDMLLQTLMKQWVTLRSSVSYSVVQW